ncbi:uncharacterized protein LOC111203204 [Brassica napus]|uniref:uncharacterized protein LOC111203204 n=1 Tax=Brassica napus TaxID=3708 RepID=UPI000BBEB7EB|nr:uncharacterized protein LOC111203204 [Brassica napus]
MPLKVLHRISTSCKFKVLLGQETIKIKLPKTSERRKKHEEEETDTYKKMKEEKRKRDFIRPRLVFRVKKITSVITGVLGRKKKHLQVKTEEREMILQKKLLKLMRPWLLLKQRLKTTRRRCLITLEICHIDRLKKVYYRKRRGKERASEPELEGES